MRKHGFRSDDLEIIRQADPAPAFPSAVSRECDSLCPGTTSAVRMKASRAVKDSAAAAADLDFATRGYDRSRGGNRTRAIEGATQPALPNLLPPMPPIYAAGGGYARSCSPGDFEIIHQADLSPAFRSAITGTVTLVRKSNRVTKTYAVGSGTSWLSVFESDLKQGVFDHMR